MSGQVLLLRGINVGGHGKLPMADLRALLDRLGAHGARTHLQSGNAVCPEPVEPGAVSDQIEANHGFRLMIVSLDAAQWQARIASHSFPTDAPKALHGFFHDGPALDTAPLSPLLGETEQLSSQPGVLWLYTPGGIGRSRVAAKLSRAPVTARNWNTIAAISTLLDGL